MLKSQKMPERNTTMNNITFINNALRHLGETGRPTQKWFGMGGNWCDMYVTRCFHETDKSLWFGKQSYCPTTIRLLRAHWAEIPMFLAMPGDVIFFDWDRNGNPNHIGLVLKRVTTSEIITLEGNTGKPAKVRKKDRNDNYPVWIFRPPFKPKSTPKKGELDPDGDFGFRSIYMLQVVLGLTPTGILTKQTVIALQKAVGATPDGAWGRGTSKKVQKKTGATVDGDFGPKSVKALQKWINKLWSAKKNKPAATVKKTKKTVIKKTAAKKTATKKTASKKKVVAKKKTALEICTDNMCSWATKIAKSGKYKYKKWTSKESTHLCPICHPGSGNGWNCIGFSFAVWHHGGKLKSKCNCGVITNGQAEKLLKLPIDDANKLARKLIGINNVKVIRNGGKPIPLSMLKKGDILEMYKGKNGKTYYHTAFYMGGGKYADSSKTHKPNIKAGMTLSQKRKSHTKVAIRYTGV